MTKFKPMQPCNADMDKIEYPCYAQRKWDGLKLIIRGKYPNIQYLGRSMKPPVNKWLIEYLNSIFDAFPDTEFNLSCEIQAGGSLDGCDGLFSAKYRSFDDIMIHVFDETTYLDLPRRERDYKAQMAVQEINHASVRYVPIHMFNSEDELLAFHAENEANVSTDGTVVIRMDLPFKSGKRTVNEGYCVKIKDFKDAEATIIGFNERVENTNPRVLNPVNGKMERSTEQAGLIPQGDLGSFLCTLDGEIFSVGSGLNDKTRPEYWARRDELLGTKLKFKYQRLTKYGVPLLPVFLGLRSEIDMESEDGV